MTIKKQNNFCIIPWLLTHVETNGQRKLCCMSDPYHNGTNKEETSVFGEWNSKRVKKIRRTFLNNQIPQECLNCIQTSTNNLGYNDYFREHVQKAIEKTLPDGTYSEPPIFLDYRLSNICNLSCRMCNSYSSSTIKKMEQEAEILDLEIIDQKKQLFRFEEAKQLIATGNIKYIYFADGEPFLSQFHWEIINFCIEKNLAKNISLLYSSNLSFTTYKNKSIFLYLKHFKNTELKASLDGIGATLEFIRSGISFEKWRKSLDEWIQFTGPDNITFNIVVTIPTLLDLASLIEFALSTGCKLNFSNVIETEQAILFSPRSLDRNSLTLIINKELSKIRLKWGHVNELEDYFKQLLENKLLVEEGDFETSIQKLVKAFNYYGEIDPQRKDGTSTIEWFLNKPELIEWIQKILASPPKLSPSLTKLIQGQVYFYKKHTWPYFKENLNIFNTLIFDLSNKKDVELDSFLKEIIFDSTTTSQVVIIIGPSSSLFNRILNWRKKDRYFSSINKYVDKKNLMGLHNFLKRHTTITSSQWPISVTAEQIIVSPTFQNKKLFSLVNFLGKSFPSIFNIHVAWKIDMVYNSRHLNENI